MIKASQILECYQIELVEKLEDLLDRFYQDLIDSGLKSRTAERHIANTEIFLIEYHAFYFLGEIHTLCPEKIYDFLGIWYFQKLTDPSENDLLGILVSLKKFFTFAAKTGILSQSKCQQLKAACNDRDFFLQHYHQYEKNPDLYYIPHPTIPSCTKTTLDDFAHRLSNTNMDEMILEALVREDTGLSLEEMIDQLMRRFRSFQPLNNVISLAPFLETKSPSELDTVSPQKTISPSFHTLTEHCMSLHRSNLVFMRWLDRYNCRIGELPTEAIAACLDCDNLLACLLAQLNVELISSEEVKLGHKLLDLMDKMLWKARYQITHSLGLDLRSLPL